MKKIFKLIERVIFFLVVVLCLAPEWPAFQEEQHQIKAIIGRRTFDFLVWEARALAVKGEAFLTAGHSYLNEAAQKELVLDYLALIGEVRFQEAQINSIYADPLAAEPKTAAFRIQTEVDEKREQLAALQPVAEAVLQEQVGVILAEEGFDILGQAWPPVQMHMTPLPFVLVVSPRDEIRQLYNYSLEPGLAVAGQEEIEAAILDSAGLSALVVPIGGVGLYPAMVLERSDINFLVNTIAHEWAHHWLTMHPLGLSYAAGPGLRTINETTASIVGDEIGAKVIERFYPEFAPEEEAGVLITPDPAEPPSFDFRAEMAETRIRTDELLAEGRIDEAEAYMEQRRQFFWDNGYLIRKLNQAYFAFYGAYADTPGQTGSDPIGPSLLALRGRNRSLRAFMDQIAPITSVEELFELVEG